MSKSKILDNFLKTAEKEATPPKNPRWDSRTIEQIAKLYNLKPDMPKEMEYEHNIMENAHPDSVYIAPAYDRLNGLVENNNERQNIIINILKQFPRGTNTQHRYAQAPNPKKVAEKQLVLSLVKIANDLDNKNSNLTYLADTCLTQATIVKTALFPALLVGAAALLGIVYAKNHLAFHSDGFEQDYQKTISEIDDILNSNSDYGVGYSYTKSFLQTMTNLKTHLNTFHDLYTSIAPDLDRLQPIGTGKELIAAAKQSDSQNLIDNFKKFRAEAFDVGMLINTTIEALSNDTFKQMQISDKGGLTSLIDAVPGLHGGKTGLVADDMDNVVQGLKTIKTDIINILGILKSSNSVEQKTAQVLKDQASQIMTEFNPEEKSQSVPETKNDVPNDKKNVK